MRAPLVVALVGLGGASAVALGPLLRPAQLALPLATSARAAVQLSAGGHSRPRHAPMRTNKLNVPARDHRAPQHTAPPRALLPPASSASALEFRSLFAYTLPGIDRAVIGIVRGLFTVASLLAYCVLHSPEARRAAP